MTLSNAERQRRWRATRPRTKLKRELRGRIEMYQHILDEIVPNLPLTVVQQINKQGIDSWLVEMSGWWRRSKG